MESEIKDKSLEEGVASSAPERVPPLTFNGYFPTMAPMPSPSLDDDDEDTEFAAAFGSATAEHHSEGTGDSILLKSYPIKSGTEDSRERAHLLSDVAEMRNSLPNNSSSPTAVDEVGCDIQRHVGSSSVPSSSFYDADSQSVSRVKKAYHNFCRRLQSYAKLHGSNSTVGARHHRFRRQTARERCCNKIRSPENCMFLPLVYFAVLFFTFIIYQVQILSKGTVSCNGSNAYCSLKYNELVQVATFRSYAVGEHVLATQEFDIAMQLESGIRVFHLDLEWRDLKTNDVLDMCATKCLYMDGGRFIDALATIKDFLDSNSYDIVTLFLKPQSSVHTLDVASVLKTSGITPYAYSQSVSATSWPTIYEMANDDKKLVIFLDSDVDYARWPWLLREMDFVCENELVMSTGVNFSNPTEVCSMVAPKNTPRLLSLLSHVVFRQEEIDEVSGLYPDRQAATEYNSKDSIIAHAKLCTEYRNEMDLYKNLGLSYTPNFIAVPFYTRGGAVQAASVLNLKETSII